MAFFVNNDGLQEMEEVVDPGSRIELRPFGTPPPSNISPSSMLSPERQQAATSEGYSMHTMYSPVSTKDLDQIRHEDDTEDDGEEEGEDEDEEENSHIPEIAAVVSNKDDPHIPCFTFRFWVLGLTSLFALSFINQFFFFRDAPLVVGSLVIQLVSYPAGRFLERVLPQKSFTTFGHTWTLNPGPFNVKEHVLIVIMAACGSGTAYAVDIIVIQKVFYGQDFGFLANLLLILTTQMVGYGMAGIMRRYLVYPAAMIWPANLATVALFNTLHQQGLEEEEETERRKEAMAGYDTAGGKRMPWSRQKYFAVVASLSFFYYWLPAYIFPAITSLTVLCWIAPSNIVLSQITGANGLGVGVVSLDWNTITAFLGSPLVTPWWAQVNILLGLVLFAWVLLPIAYYTDLWDAKRFPIVNAKLYTVDGHLYDTLAILTPQKTLDNDKYLAYGPLRITTFFAISYGIAFASLTAILTHTFLYQRHQIWATWQTSRGQGKGGDRTVDIHYKLMQAYKEVPEWWYLVLFCLMTALSIITCEVWDYGLPWWGVILSLLISVTFALPVGLIQAVTNQQPGLNVITEFVIGYILPGRPIANVVFKTYGYISMSHAMGFVGDLKLGQYMKIPPRAMFWAQISGTLIAGFVNLLTANWLLRTRPHICTPEGRPWGCPAANVFFSASVIWGVIAPDRMFGPTSIYHPLMYFFLIGALIPLPFYFLTRCFPDKHPIASLLAKVHTPVLLNSVSIMPPARAFQFTNWAAVGFVFQYWIRRYHRSWHERFTYLTSAALDSGVAISALVIFFTLQMHGIMFPEWWGSRGADRQCPLDRGNFSGVIATTKQTVR